MVAAEVSAGAPATRKKERGEPTPGDRKRVNTGIFKRDMEKGAVFANDTVGTLPTVDWRDLRRSAVGVVQVLKKVRRWRRK